MPAPRRILSKSEFAKLPEVNRSPSAITHWITHQKLTAPALTEDGKVDVDLALAQLANELDPGQQLGQSQPITAGDENVIDPDRPLSANDRYAVARATAKELEAEGLRRRRNVETGEWMETVAAKRAWARQASSMISEFESFLTQLGPTLAADLGVDPKQAKITLRREFRAFRERQALAKRAEGGLTQGDATQ